MCSLSPRDVTQCWPVEPATQRSLQGFPSRTQWKQGEAHCPPLIFQCQQIEMGQVHFPSSSAVPLHAHVSHSAPSLLPGAHKGHKGPHSASVTKAQKKKKTPLKQSLQWHELLFTTFAPDRSKVKHCLPTARSKDNRTAEEKVAVIEWVRGARFFPALFPPLTLSLHRHIDSLHSTPTSDTSHSSTPR